MGRLGVGVGEVVRVGKEVPSAKFEVPSMDVLFMYGTYF
jgi:hypothetical protein